MTIDINKYTSTSLGTAELTKRPTNKIPTPNASYTINPTDLYLFYFANEMSMEQTLMENESRHPLYWKNISQSHNENLYCVYGRVSSINNVPENNAPDSAKTVIFYGSESNNYIVESRTHQWFIGIGDCIKTCGEIDWQSESLKGMISRDFFEYSNLCE